MGKLPDSASTAVDGEPNPRSYLETLEAGSLSIKELSAGLNERIRRFEGWISGIPGRVEASVEIPDPKGDPESTFYLRLVGRGKAWHLEYCWFHELLSDPENTSWELLIDGSLNAKMAAMIALPGLFGRQCEEQAKFIEKIREANAQFDTFAAKVGIERKEDA